MEAPEALHAPNEQLACLMSTNIIGLVIAKADGTIVEANGYYLGLIGFTRQELECGQVDWRAITPAEWLAADELAIRELHERGACTPYEKEYVRRDGTRVRVLLTDAMLPGPEGRIAAFALDVTEKARVDAALRASEKKFAAAFRSSPEAVVITALPEGRIAEANPVAERLFGYAAEEMVGRTTVELGLWAEPAARDHGLALLRRDGRIANLPARLRAKSGAIVDAELSGEIVEIESRSHLLVVVRDVAARTRAEQALRASEQKFAAAFRSSPEAVVLTALPEGRTVEANAAAARLLGRTVEEIVGRTANDLGVWAVPADRERALALMQRDGRVLNLVTRFRAKSGEHVDVEVSGELVEIEKRPHVLFVIRDITERKLAGLRLAEQIDELRRWQDAMLDREDRIQEIKREVNDLCRRLGEPARYPSQEMDPTGPQGARPEP
jgi:PAS domain S-box-containing protein